MNIPPTVSNSLPFTSIFLYIWCFLSNWVEKLICKLGSRFSFLWPLNKACAFQVHYRLHEFNWKKNLAEENCLTQGHIPFLGSLRPVIDQWTYKGPAPSANLGQHPAPELLCFGVGYWWIFHWGLHQSLIWPSGSILLPNPPFSVSDSASWGAQPKYPPPPIMKFQALANVEHPATMPV